MAKKATLNMVALAAIVEAGENGTIGPMADVKPLADAGLVEMQQGDADADGNIGTRALPAGIAKHAEEAGTPATEDAGGFVIEAATEDELKQAATKRRAGRTGGEKYPFGKLEVGQKFAVPKSDKMPDPAKSLASTVSSATARYAEETGETETVTVKNYTLDADGKRTKNEDGSFVFDGTVEVEKAIMKNTRVFKLIPTENGATVVRTV